VATWPFAFPFLCYRPVRSWVLVLDRPSSDPNTIVAGLPLALRLALDAQAGGAEAIVLSDEARDARAALDDSRLELPVLPDVPAGARAVRVPASYVVHRSLFKALCEAEARDPAPANERDLAAEPFAVDAPYAFDAVDVRDAESRRRAERALFRSLRKPQDGWTSRHLNRYISLTLSRLLVKTPLRPNQVSLGILGVGLFGAYLAAQGTYQSMALGAALFQAQSVLDGCDGEMSRVTHRGSHLGEWLDTIGDDLTNYSFFIGAAIGLERATGQTLYLAAGLVVLVAGVIASGLEYRYLVRIGSGDLLRYPLSQGEGTGRLGFIQPLFKRDTFVLLTLVAALLGWLGPMLCLFAAGAVGVLVAVLKTEHRLARERRERSSEGGS
jgi:phosphatidylglycerophosphate synthase